MALVLALLWQAGVILDTDASDETAAGEQVTLLPADTAVVTPNADGEAVGLEIGDLAPDFEFSAFDGRRLKLSDYRGRTVFLNFWATWCGPCRAEMPEMEAVLGRFEERGLVVLGVNNGEGLKVANRFLGQLEVEFSAFAFDPSQAIVRLYKIRGMPTSYFIDTDGRITRVVIGQLSPTIMESSIVEALAGHGALPGS